MTTPQNLPNPSEAHVARFRIERGANAVGTDGILGTVQQIVVDHDTGQLRALIIRSAETGREFELPASYVRQTNGNQVLLALSRTQLAAHPELTAPYDPDHYVPLYEGVRLPTSTAAETSITSDRPVVTRIENDAAELVSAEPDLAPTAPRETVIRQQGGAQTAPVYQDPVADHVAAAAAEGLPPNLGRPTAPPPAQPRAPVPPAPVAPERPATTNTVTTGTPQETPVVQVTGSGPAEVIVNGMEASSPQSAPPPPPPAPTSPVTNATTPNLSAVTPPTSIGSTTPPSGEGTPPPSTASPTRGPAMTAQAQDIIAREAPPTPVDHQLTANATSVSTATAGNAAATLPPTPTESQLPAPPPAEVEGAQRQLTAAEASSTTGGLSLPIPASLMALLPLAGVLAAGVVVYLLRRHGANDEDEKRQAQRGAMSEHERKQAQSRLRDNMARQARARVAQARDAQRCSTANR